MEAERPEVGQLPEGLWEPIDWFLDYLRIERGASVHTIEAYRNDLTIAAQAFSTRACATWHDVSQEMLNAYERSLGPPLSRATTLRRLSSMRAFFRFLRRRRYEIAAELRVTTDVKNAKRLPKALSSRELNSLITVTDDGTKFAARDRAMWELIYGAGLRVSELVGLELGSIDEVSETIRVTGKRGKTRIVPLPTETIAVVKAYLETLRPELAVDGASRVFLSARGKPLLRQNVYGILARQAKLAGLTRLVGPHTLRHTYAVDLVRNGADLRAVQELLGHESIETTQIYTQLNLDAVRAQFDSAHPRG